MTVAGDDTASVESIPEVLGNGLVAEVITNDLLHLSEPVQHLLVSQAVQGPGKTVQASGQGEEGRAEGAADQVCGVGTDVATLVIGVDSEVETEELDEVGVAAEAELVGKVERVVLVLLDSSDLATLEDVLVDASGNGGKLGDEVHRVLKGVAPVVPLVDALGVGAGERGGLLQSRDGHGELGHGMEVGRAAVDQLLDELGDLSPRSPVGREIADLLLAGDLTGEEKPEEALGQRLLSAGRLGEKLLAFRNGLAAESDTLLGVQNRALPY